MNTKAKGAALERRFMDLLEAMGYKCEKARAVYAQRMAGPPRAVSHDFFRCLDLIAKRGGDKTLWVQVTTDKVSIAGKVREFKANAADHFSPEHDDVWIVRWKSPANPGERGEWQILRWAEGFEPREAWLIKSDAHTWPWEGTE